MGSKKMTELWAIGLVLIAAVVGAFGQLNFKLGSEGLPLKIRAFLGNKHLIIGVILYALNTVIFIIALRGGELTVLYPLVATNYIWTVLLAKKFLNEKINLFKWTGLILIVIGVAFIV
jgi:undecaprenyl phosphate-alpha-L-ara4N flippase subunit ArnE